MIQKTENLEFHLSTKDTSYIIRVLPSGHLATLYYGKRIREKTSYENMYQNYSMTLGCSTEYSEETEHFTLESTCLELATYGKGDYREPSVMMTHTDGSRTTDFTYSSYRIYEGKDPLEGLPSTFVNEDQVRSLEIMMVDEVLNIQMLMSYSVFFDSNVIARSVKIINSSEKSLFLDKIMSMNIDMHGRDFDVITLDGRWIKERHVHRRPLSDGTFLVESKRGVSSSNHNPFMALVGSESNENFGDAYGFSLVYSGNHKCLAELSSLDISRIQIGINDFDFRWKLDQGESFQTPEVLMTYSDKGLSGMSRHFHRVVKNNLIDPYWQNRSRPILLNNWEATYFDFTEKKLMSLAKEAKNMGIELFVLDDGWFGTRDDDTTSLGDWFEHKKKLPNGLESISKKIRKLGLEFGIWVEPEMVSVKSKLYENHPDWAIKLPNRSPSYGRNQLVLDLSNDEVINYLYDILSDVFTRSQVSYVKWDMNRNLSDLYTDVLQADRQAELSHRYVLGLYKLLGMLKESFPKILFESCASGGNRFDLGMLYYMPQTWTSDNTDAVERVKIQHGTSMVYPLSTMGAHVSDSPSHQVLRSTPLERRFNVAAFGLLGYELDLTALTPFDKNVIKKQIEYYKKYRKLLQFGNFYRLSSPFDKNISCWMVVSDDQKEAIVGYYQTLQHPSPGFEQIKLKGLSEDLVYEIESRPISFNIRMFGNLINKLSPVKIRNNGIVHTLISNRYEMAAEKETHEAFGDELMYSGLRLKHQFIGTGYNDETRLIGDFGSRLYHLKSK